MQLYHKAKKIDLWIYIDNIMTPLYPTSALILRPFEQCTWDAWACSFAKFRMHFSVFVRAIVFALFTTQAIILIFFFLVLVVCFVVSLIIITKWRLGIGRKEIDFDGKCNVESTGFQWWRGFFGAPVKLVLKKERKVLF